jgi:hypothetical protein
MQQTVFSDIIAKVVILVDWFLECFVTVTWTNGALANCTGGGYTGSLTACGYALVSALTSVTVTGLGALSGLMAGLSVYPT